MDVNMFFRKLMVQSETIRKYLERKNISISPRAMYAYVCNGNFVWEEKEEFFKELLNVTEDAELKEEIRNKLEANKRVLEMFKNQEGCVYLIKATEDHRDIARDLAPSAYANYESAWQIGRRVCFGDFIIYKCCSVDRAGNNSTDMKENHVKEGEAHFRKDGKLKYVYIKGEEELCKSGKIENSWYTYSHPFKKGDIVRRLGDDECICVVDYVPESDEKINEKESISEEWEYLSYGIEISTLNSKTGRIVQDYPIHPYELEYYQVDTIKDKDYAYTVMQEWSQLLEGKSKNPEDMLVAYYRLRKEIERSAIENEWLFEGSFYRD